MHIGVSIRIIGVLLMLFSGAMLPSLAFGLIAEDGSANEFSLSFGLTLLAGVCLWLPTRHCKNDLYIRDGFLVTALFWTVLGVFGSLPFLLSQSLNMSIADSIFESVSGLTTTGSTVIVGLDDLPRSILFYRQLLQWLGGIGIIVLAVAILPMLGIGGMQLYRAESTGPSKDSKLTPRITGTAKALFGVYAGLTITCGFCYWLAGMSVFDAISHAFSTVATGGASTHDASMGFFNSELILSICTIFMVLGAVSFGLMFLAFQRRDLSVLRNDSETTFFSWILLLAGGVTCITLIITGTLPFNEAVVHGVFQTVSIATSYRLYHPGLFNLACFSALFTADALVYGRLRWLDRRRHESDAGTAHFPPGDARTKTAAAPQRGDSAKARFSPGAARSCQRCMELFRGLYGQLCRVQFCHADHRCRF